MKSNQNSKVKNVIIIDKLPFPGWRPDYLIDNNFVVEVSWDFGQNRPWKRIVKIDAVTGRFMPIIDPIWGLTPLDIDKKRNQMMEFLQALPEYDNYLIHHTIKSKIKHSYILGQMQWYAEEIFWFETNEV
jgi:hypothetical protein